MQYLKIIILLNCPWEEGNKKRYSMDGCPVAHG